MSSSRPVFRSGWLPYALLAPQLIITVIFFIWPAGGPVQATTTLIYKIYREGFAGLDLSTSAAQSVVLMVLVIILTVVQFRYVESKVRYQ